MANAAESGIISNHPRLGTELRLLLRLSATDPAAARNRIRRAIGTLRARWTFRKCQCGELVNVAGRVSVKAQGRIELGARVQFWEGVIPQELVSAAGAELTIGALCMFDYGASVRAQRSIRIG